MGRQVKRVALDFEWPSHEVWEGYLTPGRLRETTCQVCGADGLTPTGRAVSETFYPHQIGYGREVDRLAWHDKIGQVEVDNLVEHHRLHQWGLWDRVELPEPYEVSEHGHEIRYQFVRNDKPTPTAEEVNAAQHMGGFSGHDGINRHLLVRFRCEQLGIPMACVACEGHGTVEAYPGQRAEAEAWKATEPPEGGGWQLWETVSEGSPVSPVFPTDEALAAWLTTPEGGAAAGTPRHPVALTLEQACGFVREGWAPTGFGNAGGYHNGVEYVASDAAVGDLFDND